MATIRPCFCQASTIRILCSGDTRAYTEIRSRSFCSCSSLIASNSVPLTARSPGSKMPIFSAIAMAVTLWSPVIITGRMPARRAVNTAGRDSGRGGSIIAAMPRKTKPCSSSRLQAQVSATGR